jgi:hypothetical protein
LASCVKRRLKAANANAVRPRLAHKKNMPMGFNPIFLDAVYKKNIPPLLRFIFFRRAPAAAGASTETRWVTGAAGAFGRDLTWVGNAIADSVWRGFRFRPFVRWSTKCTQIMAFCGTQVWQVLHVCGDFASFLTKRRGQQRLLNRTLTPQE